MSAGAEAEEGQSRRQNTRNEKSEVLTSVEKVEEWRMKNGQRRNRSETSSLRSAKRQQCCV